MIDIEYLSEAISVGGLKDRRILRDFNGSVNIYDPCSLDCPEFIIFESNGRYGLAMGMSAIDVETGEQDIDFHYAEELYDTSEEAIAVLVDYFG